MNKAINVLSRVEIQPLLSAKVQNQNSQMDEHSIKCIVTQLSGTKGRFKGTIERGVIIIHLQAECLLQLLPTLTDPVRFCPGYCNYSPCVCVDFFFEKCILFFRNPLTHS